MKTKISIKVLCFVAIASLALLLAAPLTESQAQDLPKSIGIGTHPKGSLLNVVGSAFAKVFSAKLGIEATDRPYMGYTAWLPLVNRGELDLGICTSFDPHYGYRGMKPYREKLSNLRLIASGSKLNTGWVTPVTSGIKSLSDLKGKRVAMNRTMVSSMKLQEGSLIAAGLDPKKDIRVIPGAGVAEEVRSLIEGRSDVCWGAVGMALIKELIAKRGPIRWIPMIDAPESEMAKKSLDAGPGADYEFVKAGKKRTVGNDTWLWAAPIYLMGHKGLSDEGAYQLAKTTWESQKDLIAVHPVFRGWKHETTVSKRAVVPYHPGAIRFYKEQGVWPAEMDQVQKRLLSE